MTSSQPSNIHNLIAAQLRASGCVFAEDEADLLIAEAPSPDELTDMVARRISGEPLEYILGWAEFCDLRIIVKPGVFVPRRRTEFLVSQATALTRPGDTVLDLCCGSGALGVALNDKVGGIQLTASDIESAAVECARKNLKLIGGEVYQSDLYKDLPQSLKGRINTMLVNAPYVPTESIQFMPAEARLYEPLITLNGGSDGLDIQRQVAAGAADWLAPGGHVLIETSARQALETATIFTKAGLTTRIAQDAELDTTVIIATKKHFNM